MQGRIEQMGQDRPVIEKADAIQKLDRGLVVAAQAVVELEQALRGVHVHRYVQFARSLLDFGQDFGTGIELVRKKHGTYPVVIGTFVGSDDVLGIGQRRAGCIESQWYRHRPSVSR